MKRFALIMLIIAAVASCKKKAGDAAPQPSAVGSSAPEPNTASPATPPSAGSSAPSAPNSPAEGSATAGAGSDADDEDTRKTRELLGSAATDAVEMSDKAEHYADGRICCVYHTEDQPGAQFEVMQVSECQNFASLYAPLKRCDGNKKQKAPPK